MSDNEPAAADRTVKMCDHICLKDDGHVERDEPHFYGYEHPSPRAVATQTAPDTQEESDMPDEKFQPISVIPSHISPPTDGVVYFTFDRGNYEAQVGTYKGDDFRALRTRPFPPSATNDGFEWDLWRVVVGGLDLKIEAEDSVLLDRSGFRFFTCPRYVNG